MGSCAHDRQQIRISHEIVTDLSASLCRRRKFLLLSAQTAQAHYNNNNSLFSIPIFIHGITVLIELYNITVFILIIKLTLIVVLTLNHKYKQQLSYRQKDQRC